MKRGTRVGAAAAFLLLLAGCQPIAPEPTPQPMLTGLPDFAGLFAKMDENEDPAAAYEAAIDEYAALLHELGACVADRALTETIGETPLSDGETAAAHWFFVSIVLAAPLTANVPELAPPTNYNLLTAAVDVCPNRRNGQTDTPTPLPAAAGLHDFAGLFAAFDGNDDATDAYIELLQNFLPCVEAHGLPAGMNEEELTAGELTAARWHLLNMTLWLFLQFEGHRLETPATYNALAHFAAGCHGKLEVG